MAETSLHVHRINHSASKLPSFRMTDRSSAPLDQLHIPSALDTILPPATDNKNPGSQSISTNLTSPRNPSSVRRDSVSAFLPPGFEARIAPAPYSKPEDDPPVTSQIPLPPATKSTSEDTVPRKVDDNKTTAPRPLIAPIRSFKTSRKSVEMNRTISHPSAVEEDNTTLRALEASLESEQNSDDSDLFLKVAKEEETARQADTRRSRIGFTNQRQSLPISNTSYQPPMRNRRGSDQESASGSYRPSFRDRPPTSFDDVNRSRYYGASRSSPSTPRVTGSREISPEALVRYGGRRPSIPDSSTAIPSRTPSYRQSNLSYSTPRTYNSSPLVTRTMDVGDGPETQRAAEGTASTVSTTAPSTVWDELEDLKSRIHRLELTGKMPATSGAAISHASGDRPPTATTTVTTMSTSPKRGRGNSLSPTDSVDVGPSPGDTHPLLHSALAKSKPLLSSEVYRALEATASDALAIASMMGSPGQPGPISSSQSTIGAGGSTVSDRQVRRKTDSMCRSLTELCLALSEGKSEQGHSIVNQASTAPGGRDAEIVQVTEPSHNQRPPAVTDLSRVKSSPRALSRLEARRSSLLATSSLGNSRYASSETSTPTQASLSGRRTSLLLRSRRGGTEEPEEEDETRFRTPSRATTEIGRVRYSPREYTSQQPLPDNRSPSVQSSLPVRRHFASTSLTNPGLSALPAVQNLGGRRYLDRSTPERDTSTVVGRLAEDRGQRKSSIGQGFPLARTDSLTRRVRQTGMADTSTAGQAGGHQ